MKLLVITDSYPPYHSGGYELRCKNVLEQLSLRGHDIEVITTRVHNYEFQEENNIQRQLHVESQSKKLFGRIYQDYQDIVFLDRMIKSFQPDIVYIWHVINLSKAIFPYLADTNMPLVFDEGGKGLVGSWFQRGAWYYFVEYRSNNNVINLLKPIVMKTVQIFSKNRLKNQWLWPKNLQAYFNSDYSLNYARSNRVPIKKTQVIHSGLDIDKFRYIPRARMNVPLNILVPGRIAPDKGVGDVINLVTNLQRQNIVVRATIVGTVFNKTYFREIQSHINELGLEKVISILPMLSHDEMADLYQKSDICFFPSHQLVGLSRIPLEAMACGCLIFTYGNEGSNEIVVNGYNGFIVGEDDSEQVATTILKLYKDLEQYKKIVSNARKYMEDNHSMDVYVNKIELFLKETLNEHRSKN